MGRGGWRCGIVLGTGAFAGWGIGYMCMKDMAAIIAEDGRTE